MRAGLDRSEAVSVRAQIDDNTICRAYLFNVGDIPFQSRFETLKLEPSMFPDPIQQAHTQTYTSRSFPFSCVLMLLITSSHIEDLAQ